MTEKYKLQQEDINSMDLNSETLTKLKQILPEVFSEGADGKYSIDVEKLKIALGGAVDVESDNKSRFSFGWSGKKQAQALANQPSTATLRPSINDSKNWDNTQNVYIEGDNLEVLKLLQKSYYGQIKMIYIDPPYNTGKDFVYKDNFHDNVKNYLQLTGQVDDEGNKISTNTDKSGRYHTDWLNMMYPRLKLARNLLKDDGVIFISIDDNEVHNLRKICDEIFGEDNVLPYIVRRAKIGGGSDNKHIAKEIDFVLGYAKNIALLNKFFVPHTLNDLKRYSLSDEKGKFFWDTYSRSGLMTGVPEEDSLYYEVEFPDGTKRSERWRRSKERLFQDLESGEAKYVTTSNGWNIHFKQRINDEGKRPRQLQIDNMGNTDGANDFDSIMQKIDFSYPKPLALIKFLLQIIVDNSSIILDFFSGSATTAHAVMQLNAEDGGNRKYICVQLPEATAPDSEAYKAGYKNICEIGKERIRRAGEKVLAEWTEKHGNHNVQTDCHTALDAVSTDLLNDGVDSVSEHGMTEQNTPKITAPDIGFKVFKLDTSNIKQFDSVDMFADDLLVANRSALDLFYELVLKQGYSLDNRQSVLDIGGTRCYALTHDDNTPFVLAVLDDTVKPNFALELLKYALTLVIVKDASFGTDEIKLNLLATLEQLQSNDNPLQIRIV